jgi:hypothetical protein
VRAVSARGHEVRLRAGAAARVRQHAVHGVSASASARAATPTGCRSSTVAGTGSAGGAVIRGRTGRAVTIGRSGNSAGIVRRANTSRLRAASATCRALRDLAADR